ncbi:MAG: SDR family oxidoreductase [Dehalococcoidia bacterium]
MQPIKELFDLSEKGAIVTGAGTGIGQAISLRLAEAGAKIMVTDIDMNAASQTVEMIENAGNKALAFKADASSKADASRVSMAAVEHFGSVDIMVNNAGIYPMSPVMDIGKSLWETVIALNLKGSFFFAQAAAEEMIKAGHGGKIINLASVDGLSPSGFVAPYNASKGGVIMLTRAMALELATYGITVNSVAPGGIVTPGTMQTSEQLQQITGKTLEQLILDTSQRMPLGRMGEPDEVARVVLFLASGASDYITGEVVVIDGGYLLS